MMDGQNEQADEAEEIKNIRKIKKEEQDKAEVDLGENLFNDEEDNY